MNIDPLDSMHEECAVFGIFGSPDAAAKAALGLHALQHRGQEGTGMVTFDDVCGKFHVHRAPGLVGDTFSRPEVIAKLAGRSAIGHNRYSTAGNNDDADSAFKNIQPLFAEMEHGGFALAHNGNLVKTDAVRKTLIQKGAIFQSTSDTELFIQFMARSKKETVVKRMIDALKQVSGAYSLVALTSNEMIGVRDPRGFRPLVLGKAGNAFVLASETCAFDIVGAKYVRDIKPGEIVVISAEGMRSYSIPTPSQPHTFCIFEFVYFARPDSRLEKKPVSVIRHNIGRELAKEHPVDADVVIGVPDSGIPSAMGFAEESRIPFRLGLIRSHYVGRTFIKPGDDVRRIGVILKLNVDRAVVAGKRVVIDDDSIVRGTNMKEVVAMVRAADAKEVHVRISSPMVKNPCFFGIDTPEKTALFASKMNLEEMTRYLRVDSLGFISLEGLYRAVGEGQDIKLGYCDACFTGNYPIPVT